MSRDVMEEIQGEVKGDKIVLYMKGTQMAPQCGFSAAVVQVLQTYGKPFKDINVLADPEKWQAVKQFSNWPTIPQIYVDGTFIGGCDIVREMHDKGQLEPLITKAFA